MIKLQKEAYRQERTMQCCNDVIKLTDYGRDEDKFGLLMGPGGVVPETYFTISQLKEFKNGIEQFIEAVELKGEVVAFKKKKGLIK